MKIKNKYRRCLSFLIVGLLGLFILSFAIGRYPVSPKELFLVISSNLFGFDHGLNSNIETVIFSIRLPRILLALLVGGALSAAGACYQGIFQNPMAAPDILGASSGAAFGAALGILLSLGDNSIPILAFVCSLFAVVLVLLVSRRTRAKQVTGIILTGIIVSNLFSAATSYVKLVADPSDQLPAITYWLMGSFTDAQIHDVLFLFLALLPGIIPMFLLRWRMNVLALDEDEALALGVNLRHIRLIIIVAATLVTSASVAVSGMVGWVGLIIPNLCRRLVGNDYRKLLPTSLLFGSLFLLIIDNMARTLFVNEVPLSILTAFVGAPFFLYLITRKEENL